MRFALDTERKFAMLYALGTIRDGQPWKDCLRLYQDTVLR